MAIVFVTTTTISMKRTKFTNILVIARKELSTRIIEYTNAQVDCGEAFFTYKRMYVSLNLAKSPFYQIRSSAYVVVFASRISVKYT